MLAPTTSVPLWTRRHSLQHLRGSAGLLGEPYFISTLLVILPTFEPLPWNHPVIHHPRLLAMVTSPHLHHLPGKPCLPVPGWIRPLGAPYCVCRGCSVPSPSISTSTPSNTPDATSSSLDNSHTDGLWII